jgi:hypothetical protein
VRREEGQSSVIHKTFVAPLIAVIVVVGAALYTGKMSHRESKGGRNVGAELPKDLMTSAWPLNQLATQYPDETRSLQSNGTPTPIKETFYSVFGTNHIHFDTSVRITVVDTRQTPNIFAPVRMTTGYTSALFRSSRVPVVGCKIEGGNSSEATSDRHCIIYDAATGIDHELYNVHVSASGGYDAAAYVPWDTSKPMRLPNGQTSADAAGLPILPLLLRYSEAATGSIPHALRGTMNLTRANANGGAFTDPASHAAGNNWGSTVYEGQRFYLRKDFPITGLEPVAVAIVKCLQTYGLVIADNGGSGYITAEDDDRWDNRMLRKLGGSMHLQDFVPVNSGPIIDSTGERVK